MTTLTTPVPLLQHHGEFNQLLDLYRSTQPMRVLEVGTYHGGSLYHWLHNAQPGATIVTVDNYATGIDNSGLYPTWATDHVNLVVIRGDSNHPKTADQTAAYAPYDWIYIDADHHQPNVEQDWRLYSKQAAAGALVVLHDISESTDPSIQVAPLWQRLQQHHTTTVIAEPGGWGIGIVHMPGQPAKHAQVQGLFKEGARA